MLKPTELGITGVKRTIKQHKNILINSLSRMLKIKGRQSVVADVCLQIMQIQNGGKVNFDYLSISDLNEIRNYFSEAMGPIWCHEQGLISGIKSHDYTFFENSSKMYDFKIYRGDEVFLVSNKSRIKNTNTLKPGDVIRLINNNIDLYRKWGNTTQYRVIDILNNNNVVSGPIKAISKFYSGLVDIKQNDYQNVIRQLVRNDVIIDQVPESILKLIEENDLTNAQYEKTEQVTGTMINFIFEKLLIQQSQQDEAYNELYVDATQGNIQILKFNLDLSGVVTFSLDEPKDINQPVSFRSKQGIERRDNTGRLKLDKLGITVS